MPGDSVDGVVGVGDLGPACVSAQSAVRTVCKGVGVALALTLFATLSQCVARAVLATDLVGWGVASWLFGYALADLLSGVVHWACDNFGSERTPLLGGLLIKPFREHHVFPERITRCRLIEQDTGNFFLLIPVLAGVLVQGSAQSPSAILAQAMLLGLVGGTFCTNLFHRWAHSSEPPRVVRGLQRLGLILNPSRHAVHHRDHSRSYCVTTGWLNPVLDGLQFFPRLQRMIDRRMQ